MLMFVSFCTILDYISVQLELLLAYFFGGGRSFVSLMVKFLFLSSHCFFCSFLKGEGRPHIRVENTWWKKAQDMVEIFKCRGKHLSCAKQQMISSCLNFECLCCRCGVTECSGSPPPTPLPTHSPPTLQNREVVLQMTLQFKSVQGHSTITAQYMVTKTIIFSTPTEVKVTAGF